MLHIDHSHGEITYKVASEVGQVQGRITYFEADNYTLSFTLMGKTVPDLGSPVRDLGLFLQALGTDLLLSAKTSQEIADAKTKED